MIIMHFALANEWNKESKTYNSSNLENNGYITCFKPIDISKIKTNLSTLKNYVILCIDQEKITSEIKVEDVFINIYGEINKDAVISVLPYTFDNEDKFVVTKELLDFNIINDALENLKIKYESHKYFNDGTSSRIILLNNKYIIKQANTKQLEAEVIFSKFYNEIPMLQKLAYYDNDYKYIVYDFIEGHVMHTVEDFFDLSDNIKEIVSKYKSYNSEKFGYIESPVNSWEEFLKAETNHSSLSLPDANYLLPVVNEAIDELSKLPFDKKLIHGDFGTHNFIKKNDKFIAAIDPIPVLGDPTYDLLFALTSNIDLLNYLSIDFLIEYTGETKAKVTALLKVVLYIRICRCAKYNKDWIETYMDLWNNLFN